MALDELQYAFTTVEAALLSVRRELAYFSSPENNSRRGALPPVIVARLGSLISDIEAIFTLNNKGHRLVKGTLQGIWLLFLQKKTAQEAITALQELIALLEANADVPLTPKIVRRRGNEEMPSEEGEPVALSTSSVSDAVADVVADQ